MQAVPCTGGTRDRPKIYLAAILGGSERRPYEFFFYIVPLWVNSANGKVLGRLKRRPYNFSFHVVPLWVNGASGFCPSAPLGVTFVKRHKSNQKDFFGTAQEGIKMTALRGKSRISLPLRLHIS